MWLRREKRARLEVRPQLVEFMKVASQPVQGPWPPHQQPRPDPTEIESLPIAVPDPEGATPLAPDHRPDHPQGS